MFRVKNISAVGTLALRALLGACTTTAAHAPAALAHADIVSSSGVTAGSAVVERSGDSIALKLDLNGITPGAHGLHFHTTGNCDGPGFTTAGSHLNPHGKLHGTGNPQGSHLGDLPNVTAASDGKVRVTIPLSEPVSELEAFLFDADGTAIVVHASADDYTTDPSGNSGSRIACGVLRQG